MSDVVVGVDNELVIQVLADSLRWLVHLNRGISKGGGQPTSHEWDSAWMMAELALAGVPDRDKDD